MVYHAYFFILCVITSICVHPYARYLYYWVCFNSSLSIIQSLFLSSSDIFTVIILLLSLLNLSPKSLPYSPTTFNRLCRSSADSPKTTYHLNITPYIFFPLQLSVLYPFFLCLQLLSVQIVNKVTDRIHLYFTPLSLFTQPLSRLHSLYFDLVPIYIVLITHKPWFKGQKGGKVSLVKLIVHSYQSGVCSG